MFARLREMLAFASGPPPVDASEPCEGDAEVYEAQRPSPLSGLTEDEARVAAAVARTARPMTYLELSKRAGMKVSTVRKACRRLETRGLVSKEGWQEGPFVDQPRRIVAPTVRLVDVRCELPPPAA